MSSKITIAALLVSIAVVAVVMVLHERSGSSSYSDLTRTDLPAVRTAGEASIKVLPRKEPSASSTQQVSKMPVITYEQFNEQKRCFENQNTPSSLLEEIAELRAANSPVDQNAIRFKETQLADLKKCSENQRAATQDDLSKMLEKVALQGQRAAQLEYAQNPMIDPFHTIDNLERLRAWRDRALSYVNSAIDKGDGEAMVILAGANDPFRCAASNEPFCSGMLKDIVEPDAEKAFRYYYQSELVGNAPQWVKVELSALERLLTQDQIAAAKLAAKTSSSNTVTR
jgi:TPR repeat protein